MTTLERSEIHVPVSLSNWRELHIQVRGVTPLLMNNPAKMRREESLGRKNIPEPSVEAEDGLYRLSESGALYVKGDHVRETMKNGSSGFRIGKKAARPILSGAVLENPDHPFFVLSRNGEPVTSWGIDTRRAVVQRQGILRSRPVVDLPWEFEAVFDYDAAVIPNASPIIAILQQAGQIVGLLDYRPQKGGSFGRFEVVNAWELS